MLHHLLTHPATTHSATGLTAFLFGWFLSNELPRKIMGLVKVLLCKIWDYFFDKYLGEWWEKIYRKHHHEDQVEK